MLLGVGYSDWEVALIQQQRAVIMLVPIEVVSHALAPMYAPTRTNGSKMLREDGCNATALLKRPSKKVNDINNLLTKC